MKISSFLKHFLISLVGFFSLALIIHVAARHFFNLFLLGDLLIPAYLFNFGFAAGMVLLLSLFRERLKFQVGFLFMGGSLFKFLGFFLFFHPEYNLDGAIKSAEFATFFVPYVIALAIETIYASKLLRILEDEDSAKQQGNTAK